MPVLTVLWNLLKLIIFFLLEIIIKYTYEETLLYIIIYCFYKTFSSYLHCEWATEQQLLKDKRIQQKIKRFKLRQAQRAHFLADVRKSFPEFGIIFQNFEDGASIVIQW